MDLGHVGALDVFLGAAVEPTASAYLSIKFPTYQSLWQRIVTAVKYIVGVKSRDPFDSICLTTEDAEKLRDALKLFVDDVALKRGEK
jgi:hypothetical protein